MYGFDISSGKGFHIGFENGYVVSVQFGPGNYCNNYDMQIGRDEIICGKIGCENAEVAILKNHEGLIAHDEFDGDTVGGRYSPEDVLRLLNWAASQPKEE